MIDQPDEWRRQYDALFAMRKQRDAAVALAKSLSEAVDTMTCPEMHPHYPVRCLKAVGHPETHYAAYECSGLIWGPMSTSYSPPQAERMTP